MSGSAKHALVDLPFVDIRVGLRCSFAFVSGTKLVRRSLLEGERL